MPCNTAARLVYGKGRNKIVFILLSAPVSFADGFIAVTLTHL